MIQQLQTLGISLAEIKELLEGDDSADIVELLEEHRRAIDQEMLRLLIARQNVSQLLSNYRRFMKHPLFDTVILEHMPVRQVLRSTSSTPRRACLTTMRLGFWKSGLNLRYTKRHMQDQGIPLSLFHHVGCRIPKENLERRDFTLDASFIFVDDEEVARSLHAEECPCGDYLTLFKSSYSDEGRHNTEVSGLNLLLDYAEERGLRWRGDYYGAASSPKPPRSTTKVGKCCTSWKCRCCWTTKCEGAASLEASARGGRRLWAQVRRVLGRLLWETSWGIGQSSADIQRHACRFGRDAPVVAHGAHGSPVGAGFGEG